MHLQKNNSFCKYKNKTETGFTLSSKECAMNEVTTEADQTVKWTGFEAKKACSVPESSAIRHDNPSEMNGEVEMSIVFDVH